MKHVRVYLFIAFLLIFCLAMNASVIAARPTVPDLASYRGCYYEVIMDPEGGPVDWIYAQNIAAESFVTVKGAAWHGHLVSITSDMENKFVYDVVLADYRPVNLWIGAYQPEGSSEPDGDWTWDSGEKWRYANWLDGQPDENTGEGIYFENFACILGETGLGVPGFWVDAISPNAFVNGFIVEYERPNRRFPATTLWLAKAINQDA